MKSSFLERVGAYIIDIMIIWLIASLICSNLPENDNENRIDDLSQKVSSGELTMNEFYEEYNEVLYENQKDNIIPTCISLVLTIGYYIVFVYMNKGQTIGKMIFKIRVVDKDTNNPPTLSKIIIRSLIILGILSTIISLIIINFVNKSTYISYYFILNLIETAFFIISVGMMIFKKDGRGLHDMMANTTVIKEGR